MKELPGLKKAFPEFTDVYAQVLQDVLKRVDRAFKLFFQRLKDRKAKAGFPRFKGEGRYDSFTYPQAYNGSAVLKDKRIRLAKIGEVKIKAHRPVEGNIKTVTIKREGNKWYAVITCENIPPRRLPEPEEEIVAIDWGISKLATLSNGEVIENPRYIKCMEKKLAEAQRVLSKKKKGTSAYRKAKERVARIYRKIANQRRDFLHKESLRLVRRYKTIIVERPEIKGLLSKKNGTRKQSKAIHKAISDAAWGTMIRFLRYKAAEAGGARTVIEVDARDTTRTCSSCGQKVPSLPLEERVFRCPHCNLCLDRDLNAAKNILRLGRSLVA